MARIDEFISRAADLSRCQFDIFSSLISKNSDARFGIEHGFSTIKTIDDYRRQVPVRDYQDFEPYINEIVGGAAGVLTKSPTYKFVSSSGSRAQAKIIPMSVDFVREAFLPFYSLVLATLYQHVPNLEQAPSTTLNLKADPLRAKALLRNGAQHLGLSQIEFSKDFDEVADEPGAQAAWSQIPSYLDDDLERLYYRILRSAGAPVQHLIGINPATIANLPPLLSAYSSRLVADLRSGCLAGTPIMPPQPELANQLEHRLAQVGKLTPADIWPWMQTIICWTDSVASTYLESVAQLFGSGIRLVSAPLGASEAPITLPLFDGLPGGGLAYQSVFFEFLDVQARRSAVYTADEIEVGGEYSVIVSQQSGLYRYHLRDIVRVEGIVNGLPRLSYRGRYAPERSSVQESDILDAVEQAVHETAASGIIHNFSSLISGGEIQYYLEFLPGTPVGLEMDLAKAIARGLQHRLNETEMRDRSGVIEHIKMFKLAPGSFHQYWKTRIQSGARPPQVKDCAVLRHEGAFLNMTSHLLYHHELRGQELLI